jgi:hypothetical protein
MRHSSYREAKKLFAQLVKAVCKMLLRDLHLVFDPFVMFSVTL